MAACAGVLENPGVPGVDKTEIGRVELVELVRREEGIDEAALVTVPMTGWRRPMLFDETGLPWVLPSPNMPTLETAIVYPGGCVIEGTTFMNGDQYGLMLEGCYESRVEACAFYLSRDGLVVKDNDELADVVTRKMAKIEGITASETMLSFRCYSAHDLEGMFSIGT